MRLLRRPSIICLENVRVRESQSAAVIGDQYIPMGIRTAAPVRTCACINNDSFSRCSLNHQYRQQSKDEPEQWLCPFVVSFPVTTF